MTNMQRDELERAYLDVLENIEAAIVKNYREHRELIDWNVDQALEVFINTYQSASSGHGTALPSGSRRSRRPCTTM